MFKKLATLAPSLFLLLTSLQVVRSDVVPSSRRINWTAGVQGGIPHRETIFKTLNASATTEEINTAIALCPSNQVVQLEPGKFTNTGSIKFLYKQSVTLRGAGIGRTIIIGTNTFQITTGQSPLSGEQLITSGYEKGSTTVTVSSSTGISPGTVLTLYQRNDPSLIWSRFGREDLLRQRVIVTSVSGSSVNFWPPLVYTFSPQLNPRFRRQMTNPSRNCGVEDLTLVLAPGGTAPYNCWIDSAVGFYFRNVESRNCNNCHFFFNNCVFPQVTSCYLKGTQTLNDGYGILTTSEVTGMLVDNNIFTQLFYGIVFEQVVGSVVSYNYTYESKVSTFPHQVGAYNINHGPHGIMNLFEGNVGEGFVNDGYHGSTSHQTLFRNWFNCEHPLYNDNQIAIDLERFSYYHTIVGNVLGSEKWNPSVPNAAYQMSTNKLLSFANTHVIYKLGWPDVNNNFINHSGIYTNVPCPCDYDPNVEATTIRHGNFDYQTKTVIWDPSIADTNLPKSLYLTIKPEWWDDSIDPATGAPPPWPPIGPDLTPMTSPLPAKLRFDKLQRRTSSPAFVDVLK